MEKEFDLEKLRSKDTFEWERLGKFVVRVLHRHALARGRDKAFIEDRAQEAMARLAKSIPTPREAKAFPAFVSITVTNVLIDWYRRTRTDPLHLLPVADTVPNRAVDNDRDLDDLRPNHQEDGVFGAASAKEQFAIARQVAAELGEECGSWFKITERFERGDRRLPDTGAVAKELGISVDAYYKRGERCRERLLKDPRIMEMRKR